MTEQDVKAEAEKIIQEFTIEVTILGCGKNKGNPCVVSDILCRKDARILAIIHVKGIIEANPHSKKKVPNRRYWLSILTELERK